MTTLFISDLHLDPTRPDITAQFLGRLYRHAFGEVETIAFGGHEAEVIFGLAGPGGSRAGSTR